MLSATKKKNLLNFNKEANSPSTSRVTYELVNLMSTRWDEGMKFKAISPTRTSASVVCYSVHRAVNTHTLVESHTQTPQARGKKKSEIKSGEMKMYPSLIYWKCCANFFFLLMWPFVVQKSSSWRRTAREERRLNNNLKKNKSNSGIENCSSILSFKSRSIFHRCPGGVGVGLEEGKLGH